MTAARARGVHHVALRVREVEALADFYARALGLRRSRTQRDERGIRSIWLSLGDTILMIERRERGEPRALQRSMDAVLFAIAVTERASFERRLARRGIAIENHTAFSLYFRDPEGRRIGLSHYPAPSIAFAPSATATKPAISRVSQASRRSPARVLPARAGQGSRGRKVRAP